ncbi:MAG: 4-(cytidine 5'-diphospho)-2-C-methyl-D-erythritol kinase, partial [Bacteroidia bacterium]
MQNLVNDKIKNKFVTFLSPAKINLGLKILGKRADGYHILKTIFCLIDLFDEISIQVLNHNKISLVEHQQIWPYHKDLAYLAATTLQDICQCPMGANIKLKKTIPSGSGLGGGSSNAATVLIALNQLWQLNLSQDELISIGKKLGADIPFFIYGKNALATGIGEELTPISLPKLFFVLIIPKFHLATRDVFLNLNYENLKLNQNKLNQNNESEKGGDDNKGSDDDNNYDNKDNDDEYNKKYDLDFLLNIRENDLFIPASTIKPQIITIFDDLKSFGNPAMTGSG